METKLSVKASNQIEGAFHFWLIVDDVPVAYMKACFRGDNNEDEDEDDTNSVKSLMLYDIEVREEYRGKGYSKEIMSCAAEMFNVPTIKHDGGYYTPLGYERVFKNIDYVGHKERMMFFKDTHFVSDWDNKKTRF